MEIKNYLRDRWIVSVGEILAFVAGGILAGLLFGVSLMLAGR